MQGEDAGRTEQAAFTDNRTIQDFYQQLRTGGHILSSLDGQSLTEQITEGLYPPPAPAEPGYAPQRDVEQSPEPER